MAGWRVGFCVGNRELIHALTRIKSYLDYGMFQPVQIAAISALRGPQNCVQEISSVYQSRRDALCEGLRRVGWRIEKPKATMFIWAEIPEEYKAARLSASLPSSFCRKPKWLSVPGLASVSTVTSSSALR